MNVSKLLQYIVTFDKSMELQVDGISKGIICHNKIFPDWPIEYLFLKACTYGTVYLSIFQYDLQARDVFHSTLPRSRRTNCQ